MSRPNHVVNVIVAGLGGQGVLKASDIVAEAAFRSGHDVKKSEVHGMSQRGGSVASDVRFGHRVLSPMVPPGEAEFLVVLSADQVDANRAQLRRAARSSSRRLFPKTSSATRRASMSRCSVC